MRRPHELLPGLLIGTCILACGLVGNGIYYSISEYRTGSPAEIIGMRLAFVCFLVISACVLYKLRSRQFGARPALWWGVFLAAVLAGAGADGWQAWLESLGGREAVRLPLGPVLYSV